MKKSVLVLEGEAMRSLFTSGVLDVLMDNNIDIDCTVGVSAGALVGSNYVSNQKGRTAKININYCNDNKYIGVGAIKNNKGLVGFDYLFDGEIAKHNPFDEKEFFNSKKRFVTGITNCITGKTEYYDKSPENTYKLLQASSSMPLVSKVVEINGKPYLDGAIDCNVPIDWALEQGYERIVVVLTRNKDYRKNPVSNKMRKIYMFAAAVALWMAGTRVEAQVAKEIDDKYVENDVVSLAGKKGISFSTKMGDFLFKPYALVQASATYNRYDEQGLESHYAKSVANSGFAIPNAILGFTGKAFGIVTFNLSLNAAKSGGAS